MTRTVEITGQGVRLNFETDLSELAATFAAHGGANLSAELSADLALEIVLNEIVEQACLATAATGAAIVLKRNGEMVCRASSGTNVPDLGERVGTDSGLMAACIETRQVLRCNDAFADVRADIEASQRLGVRSVIIFPLLQKEELVGVLEVFSQQPSAFGERDEITLEALARRVLKNLKRASGPMNAVALPAVTELPFSASPKEYSATSSEKSSAAEADAAATGGWSDRSHGLDVVTFMLAAVVVICAVLFATLVGSRLGSRGPTAGHGTVAKKVSNTALSAQGDGARTGAAANRDSIRDLSGAGNTMAPFTAKKKVGSPVNAAGPTQSNDSIPPAGGLLVYQNGKEVFRMPPSSAEAESQTTKGADLQRASSVESAQVLELSPDVAEGSLLHRVEPEYPEIAREQQIQGPVVLDVRISRDGTVQEVSLLGGQRLLEDAAIAAVKQWRFKPRVVHGQSVEMETKVTLNFRLPAP